MILWSIHRCRWHELPHGNSRITNERNQLVPRSLTLRSSKCSRDCRCGRHEARLYIHGFKLLLQLFLLYLQPLLFVTKLILFSLKKRKYSLIWWNGYTWCFFNHFQDTSSFQIENSMLKNLTILTIKDPQGSLTFNSLILSRRLEFESFDFWASPRNWVTIRTASIKIAALSVLGALPGSKMEPNSINLLFTQCWIFMLGRERKKGKKRHEKRREMGVLVI